MKIYQRELLLEVKLDDFYRIVIYFYLRMPFLNVISVLIPFLVQIFYDEKGNTFISSAFITSFIGILLILTNSEDEKKLNLQQAFLLTTLSW